MPLHPHQCLQFTNPTASVTSSSGSKPTISALVVEQLYCWWIFRNRFSRELGVFNSTFTLIKKKRNHCHYLQNMLEAQWYKSRCLLFNFSYFWLRNHFFIQLHLTLWDQVNCSSLGSSVHGFCQARILERVAISSCRGSSRPKDRTLHLLRLLHWQAGALLLNHPGSPPLSQAHGISFCLLACGILLLLIFLSVSLLFILFFKKSLD